SRRTHPLEGVAMIRRRPGFLCLALLALPLAFTATVEGGKGTKSFHLTLRSRIPSDKTKDGYTIAFKEAEWPAAKTAIIVCDVWDAHHCLNAVRRLEEMVPRMNEVLQKARSQGALIIHAPSSCMDAYKDHPGRKLAQSAPTAKDLPKEIEKW